MAELPSGNTTGRPPPEIGGQELPLIDGREGAIVDILRKEHLDQFSFDGLRRRSGFHQETLSRVLDRLEEGGVLSKSAGGYSVRQLRPTDAEMTSDLRTVSIPLMQTLLPDDVSLDSVTAALKGRWFGTLRWLGSSHDEDRLTMKWISEDGGIQVDALFQPGQLEVAAGLREGRKLADAVRASYELLGHLTRVYARLGSKSRVSLLKVGQRPLLPN